MPWIEILTNRATLLTIEIILFGFDCFTADYFNRDIIFLACSKNDINETLLINLLPVQAAVSGIGIAIMALLTGLNKESFFGVSITEYITSLKSNILKHRYLMVLAIMLIIVNFWSISFCYYNLAIYIFIINVLIIAWLVWNISLIFSNKFKIQEEMKQFLLEKFYNSRCANIKNTLFYFSRELAEAKFAGDTSIIIQDFKFLKDLYSKVLNLKQDKHDFEFWHGLYCSVCKNLLSLKRSDCLTLAIESIINVYENDHNRNGFQKCPMHIWEDLGGEKVFQDFNCIKLEEMFPLYWKLKKALLINTYYLKEISPTRKRELKYFSSYFYLYALRKNHDDDEMFKYIISQIFDFTFYVKYSTFDFNKETKILFTQDMVNFTKLLIDSKEETLVKDIWENFISQHVNLSHLLDKEELQYILSIQAYLYYVVIVENLVNDSERVYAQRLLMKSKPFWGEFITKIFYPYHELLTSELVESVKNQVERWEKVEIGKAKFIITPEAVEDFFFVHILAMSNNFEQSLQILKKGVILDILRQYGDIDKLNRLKSIFSNWQKFFLPDWYHLNDQTLNKKLKDIQSLLLKMQIRILEKDIPKEPFEFSNLQKVFQNKLNDIIGVLNTSTCRCNLKKQIFSSTIQNCNRTYVESHEVYTLIQRYILDFLENNCFKIFKNQLPCSTLHKYDEDIVDKVLDSLSQYQTGDTVIGFPETFLVNNESNQKYTNYLEKYTNKIIFSRGNQYIVILDSLKIILRISDLSIKAYDSTDAEINKDFKLDKGLWHYQFIGIKISLNDEEKNALIKFLKKWYCKLKIEMTIEYEFHDNSGMMIYFSNN